MQNTAIILDQIAYGTTYDAWDVFVARVHGGSERAALENYCEVSGYNQVKLHTIIKKWGQS